MKRRLPISEGSGKTVIALALVSLLALPIIFCFHSHRRALAVVPKNARMKPQEIKKRAIAIGVSLGTPKPIIGEPQFVTQQFSPEAPRGMRHLWTVDCLAGAHHYNLIFNDVSGNIESIYADGLATSSKATLQTALAVHSSGEAVQGAVQRLKDLQLVTQGTKLALVERPECDKDGVSWRMVWKVLRPETSKPYELRMVLNGSDATPLIIVNRSELERYAQD